MRINHNYFTNLAFDLAEINFGKTKGNPSVGCIIVKNKSVISSGVTSINGRPHAEFNALNKRLNFKNSLMYVTLEPCTHHGITPPCTKIIKNKKIKKVFYSFNDPDIRTYKKAKIELKKNKISFKKIRYKDKNFYKSYFLNKKEKLPLIDAKIALSKDNFTINKKFKWITNSRSRKTAHLIRSKYDCIISTSQSINKDNSILNCRLDGFNNYKPDLIIIDRNLKLNKNLKLLNMTKKRKTYLLTNKNNSKKISYFKKKNIRIIFFKKLQTINDFRIILKKIYNLGKYRVLVESGLIFLNQLLKFRLINNLYVFKSGKKLYKNGHNSTKNDYIKKLNLNSPIRVNLDDDKLFKIRIK